MQTISRKQTLSFGVFKLAVKVFGATMLGCAVMAAQRPDVILAASSGSTGTWNVVSSVCVISAGNSYAYASIPNVWSPNMHYGSGNDFSVVRYWTRLDNLNGVPITNWSYGGQGTANDNAVALFPSASKPWFGQPNIYTKWGPLGSWTGNVKLEYYVAWYNPTTMALIGTSTRIQSSYQTFMGQLSGFTVPNC